LPATLVAVQITLSGRSTGGHVGYQIAAHNGIARQEQ